MNDRWLRRGEGQAQVEFFRHRLEIGKPRAPVAVPDDSASGISTCQSGTGATEPLRVMEAAGGDVGKREVCEIQIGRVPRVLRHAALLIGGLSEEGEFESKAATIGGAEVAGPIPPLG